MLHNLGGHRRHSDLAFQSESTPGGARERAVVRLTTSVFGAANEGTHDAHRAAVDVRHRPAVGPFLRRRLRAGQPVAPGRRRCAAGRPRRCRPRRRAAARVGAVVAGRVRRRARRRPPGRRPRWRADAGRRADEPLHRPGRHGRRGASLPRRGRTGEPRQPARLPLRHRPAHRRGIRAARRPACLGVGRARHDRIRPAHRSASCSTERTRRAATAASPTQLADAIDATGQAVGAPIFSSSLRSAPDDLYEALGDLDALIVTVLAAGGTTPGSASAGGDDEAWDVERMKALDIPILQGLCLTSSREEWEASDEGVTPLDSANQIAIPEFDGRIITAPFSFKEIDEDGLPRYVADPERCARVAGIAVNHARLRHVPPAERKVALMLSAYPTKHSRVGNAVGLDTPVSAIRLLRRMRDEGYDLGPADGEVTRFLDMARRHRGRRRPHPRPDRRRRPGRGVAHRCPAHRQPRPHQRRRLPPLDVPPPGRAHGRRHRGVGRRRPGASSSTTTNEIVLATLQAGNVVVLIQPPRGFGENPVAIYHDPDLAPSHHYLAAYRWVERRFRRPCRRPPGQARLDGVAARQERGPLGVVRRRRRDRQPPARLPVPGQRPGRGCAGQAPRARHDRRPPRAADGAGRVVRRHRPARAAARRARQHRRDGPGQAAGHPRRDLDPHARRRDASRPRPRRATRRRGVRRVHPPRRRLAVRDQGRADPRRPARARPGAGGRGPRQPGARDPAGGAGLGRRVGRGARPPLGARARRGRRAVRRRRRDRGRGPFPGRGDGEGRLAARRR